MPHRQGNCLKEVIRSCFQVSKGKQRQDPKTRSSWNAKAEKGSAEGGGGTVLQVFVTRSFFSYREKERHKGRLDEARDASRT